VGGRIKKKGMGEGEGEGMRERLNKIWERVRESEREGE
jgi:hypothetical protein